MQLKIGWLENGLFSPSGCYEVLPLLMPLVFVDQFVFI